MSIVYYLGFTKTGCAVTRQSAQDYGYTHAVALLAEDGTLSRLPTFSTSADRAQRNASANHWPADRCELVEVQAVDRATFMAAKAPAAPQAPKAAPAGLTVDEEVERDLMGTALFGGPYPTREAWLLAFVTASRPYFEAAGAPLPDRVRVSVGFPSKGARSKVIGECWSSANSSDGVSEVFIVPGLQADPSRIADVLTHELIHAALGVDEGHGATFRRVMKRLGLDGKATATIAGDGWRTWAQPIVDALGVFPGAELQSGMALAGGKKTQTTRYLKVMCSCCDWTARVTAKHLAEHESLSCPVPKCAGELVQAQ